MTEPLPGYDLYQGMLAIPYLRPSWGGDGWSVVSMRYRCITAGCQHEWHGKYNTSAGDRPRLYNTAALHAAHDEIALCEGEIDTITAESCGFPAVGIAGVEAWQPHFREVFLGYATVYILADNDDAGQGLKFARKIAGELPNAKVILAEKGEDVNSMVCRYGSQALIDRLEPWWRRLRDQRANPWRKEIA
ncbi:toprim domain-containing protein [Longimycelium tulufanense]|uniref:toprim domain-containing protein n=1 Tax=Longimycelium tulufanense TaxID=907463 RepID=UPI001E648139|nr:toprim domain-containing protein [Longimycelium tulufanense]